MPKLLDQHGPYRDMDADVYVLVFEVDGHIYTKKAVISGCAKAVGVNIKTELAYQIVKSGRELERDINARPRD